MKNVNEDGLRYTRVAVALHWGIATLIIYQLVVGLFMEDIKDRAIRIPVVYLHASLGVVVLLLSIFRLLWRLTHRPPPFDPRLNSWERRSAHAVHVFLYVMMIVQPLLGWAIFSASERVLKAGQQLFWSPLRWPALPVISRLQPPRLEQVHDQFVLLHTYGGYLMIALLLGHVAGALKHQWLDGHQAYRRMWFTKPMRG